MKLVFFLQIFEKKSNINFKETLPVEAELFYADGRTDGELDRERETEMTRLIVAFRNFVNAPKDLKMVANLVVID